MSNLHCLFFRLSYECYPHYSLLNTEFYNTGTKHPESASQAGNTFDTKNQDSFGSGNMEENDKA